MKSFVKIMKHCFWKLFIAKKYQCISGSKISYHQVYKFVPFERSAELECLHNRWLWNVCIVMSVNGNYEAEEDGQDWEVSQWTSENELPIMFCGCSQELWTGLCHIVFAEKDLLRKKEAFQNPVLFQKRSARTELNLSYLLPEEALILKFCN